LLANSNSPQKCDCSLKSFIDDNNNNNNNNKNNNNNNDNSKKLTIIMVRPLSGKPGNSLK
jgi:hypothetical protein